MRNSRTSMAIPCISLRIFIRGMGGLDIFKTWQLNNGAWVPVKNLKTTASIPVLMILVWSLTTEGQNKEMFIR